MKVPRTEDDWAQVTLLAPSLLVVLGVLASPALVLMASVPISGGEISRVLHAVATDAVDGFDCGLFLKRVCWSLMWVPGDVLFALIVALVVKSFGWGGRWAVLMLSVPLLCRYPMFQAFCWHSMRVGLTSCEQSGLSASLPSRLLSGTDHAMWHAAIPMWCDGNVVCVAAYLFAFLNVPRGVLERVSLETRSLLVATKAVMLPASFSCVFVLVCFLASGAVRDAFLETYCVAPLTSLGGSHACGVAQRCSCWTASVVLCAGIVILYLLLWMLWSLKGHFVRVIVVLGFLAWLGRAVASICLVFDGVYSPLLIVVGLPSCCFATLTCGHWGRHGRKRAGVLVSWLARAVLIAFGLLLCLPVAISAVRLSGNGVGIIAPIEGTCMWLWTVGTRFWQLYGRVMYLALAITIVEVFVCVNAVTFVVNSRYAWRHGLYLMFLLALGVPVALMPIPLRWVYPEWVVHAGVSYVFYPINVALVSVLVLHQYIVNIPRDVFHAARVDGLADWSFDTTIRLGFDAVVAGALVTFCVNWRFIMWPLAHHDEKGLVFLPIGARFLDSCLFDAEEALVAYSLVTVLPMLGVCAIAVGRAICGACFIGNEYRGSLWPGILRHDDRVS